MDVAEIKRQTVAHATKHRLRSTSPGERLVRITKLGWRRRGDESRALILPRAKKDASLTFCVAEGRRSAAKLPPKSKNPFDTELIAG